MKAVVFEIGQDYTIVADKYGRFFRIKTNPSFEVGEQVETGAAYAPMLRKAAALAAACFMMLISMVSYQYFTPVNYINIDINPSIELSANCFGRVISAKAVNTDAQAILAGFSDKNKTIGEAVEQILASLAQKHYFEQNAILMITVSGGKEEEISRIEDNIKTIAQQKTADTTAKVVTCTSTLDKHQTAQALNISTGKLLLIEDVQKNRQDISADDLTQMPMKDIFKIIKTYNPQIVLSPPHREIQQETSSPVAAAVQSAAAAGTPPVANRIADAGRAERGKGFAPSAAPGTADGGAYAENPDHASPRVTPSAEASPVTAKPPVRIEASGKNDEPAQDNTPPETDKRTQPVPDRVPNAAGDDTRPAPTQAPDAAGDGVQSAQPDRPSGKPKQDNPSAAGTQAGPDQPGSNTREPEKPGEASDKPTQSDTDKGGASPKTESPETAESPQERNQHGKEAKPAAGGTAQEQSDAQDKRNQNEKASGNKQPDKSRSSVDAPSRTQSEAGSAPEAHDRSKGR